MDSSGEPILGFFTEESVVEILRVAQDDMKRGPRDDSKDKFGMTSWS